MPPREKDPLAGRIRRYKLFLDWLQVRYKLVLQLAYREFVKETGLRV